MRIAPFALLLAVAPVAPAFADTMLCTFSSANLDIEFAGDRDVRMVYVHMRAGPRALPARSYRLLAFDARTARIEFAFDNPGDPTLPSSFTLKGTGREVWIVIDGKRERGELRCGP